MKTENPESPKGEDKTENNKDVTDNKHDENGILSQETQDATKAGEKEGVTNNQISQDEGVENEDENKSGSDIHELGNAPMGNVIIVAPEDPTKSVDEGDSNTETGSGIAQALPPR